MEVDLRKANELFHDVEARRYDDKWGIRYDEENARRVRRKFEKLLRGPFPHVDKLLEVGCGTGYVGLNIASQDGLVGEMSACDISQGMVDTCNSNAKTLGVSVKAKRSELEKLDYPDEEFDMVIGHAILHHVPDIKAGLSEVCRVLKPGGVCMLAGEPTLAGDLLGKTARAGTSTVLKIYTRLGGYFGGVPAKLREDEHGDDDEIREYEQVVDIHTFRPAKVCRIAKSVGFEEARFEGEELFSSFVGWITRCVENQLSFENITFRWRYGAYTTYLKLNALDDRVYPYLPSSLFYNMLLYARKPL